MHKVCLCRSFVGKNAQILGFPHEDHLHTTEIENVDQEEAAQLC